MTIFAGEKQRYEEGEGCQGFGLVALEVLL